VSISATKQAGHRVPPGHLLQASLPLFDRLPLPRSPFLPQDMHRSGDSDICSPMRQFQAEHASTNRDIVAQWLGSVCPGKTVPCASDFEFRSALQDGIVLCRAINVVAQSANMKVGEKGGVL